MLHWFVDSGYLPKSVILPQRHCAQFDPFVSQAYRPFSFTQCTRPQHNVSCWQQSCFCHCVEVRFGTKAEEVYNKKNMLHLTSLLLTQNTKNKMLKKKKFNAHHCHTKCSQVSFQQSKQSIISTLQLLWLQFQTPTSHHFAFYWFCNQVSMLAANHRISP